MNLAKRIRDLRYSKGWGPENWPIVPRSRGPLYQIERGNTSKPQAGTLRRISRALGVPLESCWIPRRSWRSRYHPRRGLPRRIRLPRHDQWWSRAIAFVRSRDELIEKFRMLLGSPLADGIARIVEESFRLLPIIPPPVAQAEPSRSYVPSLDIHMPRRGRGRPRITNPEWLEPKRSTDPASGLGQLMTLDPKN